ncbi:MAG: stage III sporulation protein AE [Oscillospiraceae bacterium]|nr:stage III sporulation protein AE [Oscillospiraceae bacterium]
MRRIIRMILLVLVLSLPVSALDITAPQVPESGRALMPSSAETFGEGLLEVIRDVLGYFHPELKEAASVCMGVIAAAMVASILKSLPGSPMKTVELAGTVAVASMLLNASNSLISLGAETVHQISEYGKLLLPAMTAAMAAQGGVTSASALYAGTAFFDSLLTSLVVKLLTPMIYVYLALSAAGSAIGGDMLKKLRDFMKWAYVWTLKIILYVFTGYISITGVVSGTTDAATLKAAKLTISGVVPVVGSILSDASEAVLVSAGTVKNAVGVYGLLAIIAVWIGPFLKIGVHYLMLKLTAGVCGLFSGKPITDLVGDFSSVMGFVLAMTGAVSLMFMISTVCFMKGVG